MKLIIRGWRDNPLSSLFRKNKHKRLLLLWKWLIIINPKTFFSQNKNKLIRAAAANNSTTSRLVAIPEWPSPRALLHGVDTLKMQVNQALASRRLSFERDDSCSILATAGFPFKECEVVAVETDDPYRELVTSMEEMLEVYGVKREEGKMDWDCLENLLAWYLRVNTNNTHDFIVSAFVQVCFSFLYADNNNSKHTNRY